MTRRDLFTEDPDEAKESRREPGEHQRCTPELLLAFIRESQRLNGRWPTLAEIKKRFGGILGAMVMAWELERRGLLGKGKEAGQ